MLTNKRQIKKFLSNVCDETAQRILPAAVYAGLITEDNAEDILTKLAELHTQAAARLAISFDKTAGAFDNPRAYHTAKRAYYKTAYAQALKDFENGVNALLAPISSKAAK